MSKAIAVIRIHRDLRTNGDAVVSVPGKGSRVMAHNDWNCYATGYIYHAAIGATQTFRREV